VTTQANAGSLDCVRRAPHCARDDKGGVELRRALWIGSAAFGLNLLTRLTGDAGRARRRNVPFAGAAVCRRQCGAPAKFCFV